jgi:hypothetical protein
MRYLATGYTYPIEQVVFLHVRSSGCIYSVGGREGGRELEWRTVIKVRD